MRRERPSPGAPAPHPSRTGPSAVAPPRPPAGHLVSRHTHTRLLARLRLCASCRLSLASWLPETERKPKSETAQSKLPNASERSRRGARSPPPGAWLSDRPAHAHQISVTRRPPRSPMGERETRRLKAPGKCHGEGHTTRGPDLQVTTSEPPPHPPRRGAPVG